MNLVIWYAALAVALCLFAAGQVCFFRRSAVGEKGSISGIVLDFLAGWVLNCPHIYYEVVAPSVPGLRVVESVLTSLLETVEIFDGGNGYERYVIEGHPLLSSVYSLAAIFVYIVFVLFVMGFILSLLDGPSQRLRFRRGMHRKAFVFSAANERSLRIAESLPAGKHILVFCVSQLPTAEIKQKIMQMGGVYITRPVGDAIFSRRNCRYDTEVFLFDDAEAENLQKLNAVYSLDFSRIRTHIRVYAEISDIPWDLFSAPPKNEYLTVNLIRTEESFAYNQLLKHSVFENTVQTAQNKEIRLLFAGVSRKSTELLKAALFLGQMPGFTLSVMVLDAGAGRDALRRCMPEVYDECHTDGDAEYTLIYKENVDFSGCDAETILENEYPDFTWAYVDVGDDLADILMARRLYALRQRLGRPDAYHIYAHTAQPESLVSGRIVLPPEITPVGKLSELYDYRFITMSDIEKASKAIHEVRQREKAEKDPGHTIQTWQAYCGSEYNRHSVYARTLSYKFKAQLIERFYDGRYALASSDPVWKKYEHMRWNMYTRVLGYRKPGETLTQKYGADIGKLRSSAMVHPDLIPFDELSREERDKDAMKITDEIAAILRDI